MQCLKPYRLKEQQQDVPCGKCPQCTARYVSGWSFRLMQQNKIADTAYFITLTYDTEHVPLTKRGYMTLSKTEYEYKVYNRGRRKGQLKKKQISSHLQQFIKTLRYLQYGSAKSNIKYYACGEYGEQFGRPHYHVLLFNAQLDLIQKAWPYGYIHYGMDVNEASVGYTLKYMSKPSKIPMHKNDDRVKEFSLKSKGLGINYINHKTIRYHNQGHEFMHLTVDGGKKIAMPRYYKDKIYDECTRIIFGKLGFEAMQEKKNKLLSQYHITAEQYEDIMQIAIDGAYGKQKSITAKRQKNF